MQTSESANPCSAADGLETWSQSLDLAALGAKWGTPCYLFNASRLRQNFAAWLKLVEQPERILYPVKTNPALAVLRRLATLGCGLDCASRDEVDLGLTAGVPMKRISYNTPAPEVGLIRNLLRGGATVVVDSAEMLRRINDKLPPSHLRGKLVIRLNVDAGSTYLQYFEWEQMVHHGASTSKFGIPAEDVIDLLQGISLPVTGLHVHVGTMMDNLKSFEATLRLLHQLVDEIHRLTTHRITSLNLGGGLGICFLPGQHFPSITALAAHLAPLLRSNLEYFVEPGQSLVGDTMGLLMRVTALKQMRGRRWAIIDVGSDQLMKITTVSWYHQIRDQRGRPLPTDGPDAVGGPLCFAGDTILPSTSLDGVLEGEVLLLLHAGAYLEAIANRFNGRRSVSLIVVDDSTTHRATHPEDPFFSPPLQTYDWSEAAPEWPTQEILTPNEVRALRSQYFSDHAKNDRCEFHSFVRTGEFSFVCEADITASAGFVSVPFAQQIAADAVIIAVLRAMGKTIKDVSVWGTKGTFQYREPMLPNRRIRGTITLSPLASVIGGKLRMLCSVTLDGDRFSMTAEIIV